MTDEGRLHINTTTGGGCYTGGVDGHQASGWHFRDNYVAGFWCNSGLSEHAFHMWRGCRGTIIERNIMVNNARGIGFGLMSSGSARIFDDDPCGLGDTYIGHVGGTIKNNFIYVNNTMLFASHSGFDSGIALYSSCNTKVLHNTVVSTEAPYASIEWRFAASQNIEITNNIVSHNLRKREDAYAILTTNFENAPLTLFKEEGDITGKLSLKSDATSAINQGTDLGEYCKEDFDGDQRDGAPDLGADEFVK